MKQKGHAKHQRKQLSSTNSDANTKDLYYQVMDSFKVLLCHLSEENTLYYILHFDGLGFFQTLVKILLIRLNNMTRVRRGRKSRKLENQPGT